MSGWSLQRSPAGHGFAMHYCMPVLALYALAGIAHGLLWVFQ